MTPTRASTLAYQDIFIWGYCRSTGHTGTRGSERDRRGKAENTTISELFCILKPWFWNQGCVYHPGEGRRLHPGRLEGHPVLQPREKQHALLRSDGSTDSQQLSLMTTDCTVQLVQSRAARVSGVTRSRSARVRWLERLTCTRMCLRTGRKGEESWQTAAAWKTAHTQR